WTPWVVGAVTAAVMLLLLVYPIVTTLLSSFVPQGEAISWRNLSFTNFERFFSSPMYQRAVTNSLVVSLGSTFFPTLIALAAPYVVARLAMPMRNLSLPLSVVPVIAPPFVGAYSRVILLGRRGIITPSLDQWFLLEVPSICGPLGIIVALSLSYFPFVFL